VLVIRLLGSSIMLVIRSGSRSGCLGLVSSVWISGV